MGARHRVIDRRVHQARHLPGAQRREARPLLGVRLEPVRGLAQGSSGVALAGTLGAPVLRQVEQVPLEVYWALPTARVARPPEAFLVSAVEPARAR